MPIFYLCYNLLKNLSSFFPPFPFIPGKILLPMAKWSALHHMLHRKEAFYGNQDLDHSLCML